MATLCPCPKSLPKTKLQNNGWISSGDHISRQLMLNQFCDYQQLLTCKSTLKERTIKQKEMQTLQLVEEKDTDKFKLTAKSCAERYKINMIKENFHTQN